MEQIHCTREGELLEPPEYVYGSQSPKENAKTMDHKHLEARSSDSLESLDRKPALGMVWGYVPGKREKRLQSFR